MSDDEQGKRDEPRSKRRLRLMPEVLPDPTPHHVQGAPRTRTLDHLRRLMALAATTASLGVACTKEGEPPIRKEDESTAKKKSTPPDPTTTTTTTAPDTASTPTIGYGVVDPMPPPAMCAGLAASVAATATWKGAAIELKLPKSSRPDSKWSRKDPPTIYSGKITKTTWVGDDLVLEIVPDAGVPLVSVYVSAACTAGDEHVNIGLDVGTKGAVRLTLYDAF